MTLNVSGTLRYWCYFLILACSSTPAVAQESKDRISTRPLSLRDKEGNTLQAEAIRLSVPEVRGKPNSAAITLAMVRLKSTSTKPGPPTVFLHGGPGGSASGQIEDPEALSLWRPFLEIGDVILLDQRGCGRSRPSLSWKPKNALAADALVSRDRFVASSKDLARDGVAHFRAQNVDLTGYTTVESADDLNDIRLALGAEKLNLFGFSYGTHLALATVRRHGAHLANVVVFGTEGPGHTRKLPSTFDRQWERIADWVRRDRALGSSTPDLAGLTRTVLDRLKQSPIELEIKDRVTGEQRKLLIGPFGLQLILIADMGDTSDIPVLPRLVSSIDKGDYSMLRWFVEKRYAQVMTMPAVFWVMDSASGASPDRLSQIEREAQSSLFGNAMNLCFPEVDESWGTPDLGESFRAPLASDVRTLFISGTLDSNTPPQQAAEIARGFSNARHFVIENAGHEDLTPQPEMLAVVRKFLAGEEVTDPKIQLPVPKFAPAVGNATSVRHPSIPSGS